MSPSRPKILVAIPAYNCAPQLPRVLQDFDQRLLDRLWRVMVIDNGSKDGTADVAAGVVKERGGEQIEVFRNDQNYNLGGSHKVAFLRAEREGADYVAIVHGDHQATTQELHLLLDEAERDPGLSAILGARFAPGSRLQGYSALRIAGNVGLNALFTLVSASLTLDLGSGLNLFRVRDLMDHRYLGFSDSLTFNIDLLLDYYRKHSRLRFVPISWSETDQVSNARIFNVGKQALEKLLRWRVGRELRPGYGADHYTSTKVA